MKLALEHTPSVAEEERIEEQKVFSQYIERFVTEAFETQDEKYGKRFLYKKVEGETQELLNPDYLAYHNSWHTRGVTEAAERILETLKQSGMKISEKTAQIILAIAAGHDLIQNWSADKKEDGTIMRKYDVGDNEAKTAENIAGQFEHINKKEGHGHEVYSRGDIEMVKEATSATVPDFNSEKAAVVQKHLNEHSGVAARVVALADLGDAGLFGAERFLDGGKRFFRELNLDIAGAYVEDLTDEQKDQMIKRILGWARFQEVFAKGREAMLETEIAPLPESSRVALRTLFSKFSESISAAHQSAEKLAETAESPHISVNQRFIQSLEYFGYTIEDKQGEGWILP